jgi:hypothetical protein
MLGVMCGDGVDISFAWEEDLIFECCVVLKTLICFCMLMFWKNGCGVPSFQWVLSHKCISYVKVSDFSHDSSPQGRYLK